MCTRVGENLQFLNRPGLTPRINLSLRFAAIDADWHQSSDPIPINRYNVLFLRDDKSKRFDRHDKSPAFIVARLCTIW